MRLFIHLNADNQDFMIYFDAYRVFQCEREHSRIAGSPMHHDFSLILNFR